MGRDKLVPPFKRQAVRLPYNSKPRRVYAAVFGRRIACRFRCSSLPIPRVPKL